MNLELNFQTSSQYFLPSASSIWALTHASLFSRQPAYFASQSRDDAVSESFYGVLIGHNVSTGLLWRGSVEMFRREATNATSKHPSLETRPNIFSIFAQCVTRRNIPWKCFDGYQIPPREMPENSETLLRVCSRPEHENVSTGTTCRKMFPRVSYTQTRGYILACPTRSIVSQI